MKAIWFIKTDNYRLIHLSRSIHRPDENYHRVVSGNEPIAIRR